MRPFGHVLPEGEDSDGSVVEGHKTADEVYVDFVVAPVEGLGAEGEEVHPREEANRDKTLVEDAMRVEGPRSGPEAEAAAADALTPAVAAVVAAVVAATMALHRRQRAEYGKHQEQVLGRKHVESSRGTEVKEAQNQEGHKSAGTNSIERLLTLESGTCVHLASLYSLPSDYSNTLFL